MDLIALAEFLASPNVALKDTESSFLKKIDSSHHVTLCRLIGSLAYDGLITTLASSVEALVGFYLTYRLSSFASGASSSASPCRHQAAIAMHTWLLQLDAAMKGDTRLIAQYQYRQTAKDFKRMAKDAIATDSTRCRTALKVFAMQCLLGSVDATQTPIVILTQTQASLDGLLEKGEPELKGKLRELRAAVVPEGTAITAPSLGGPASIVPLGTGAPPPSASAQPVLCRPVVLTAPIFQGELQFIGGSNVSLAAFDTKAHPKEWAAAKGLIASAAAGKLSDADRENLTALLSKGSMLVTRLGFTPAITAAIAIKDPEVAAVVVSKMPKAGPYLDAIVERSQQPSGGGNKEQPLSVASLSTVLLHSPKAIDQGHMGSYVAVACSEARRLMVDKKADAETLVKLLATTLHQLLHKCARDNKEIIIPVSKKDELRKIFTAFKQVEEVATWWAEFTIVPAEGDAAAGGAEDDVAATSSDAASK